MLSISIRDSSRWMICPYQSAKKEHAMFGIGSSNGYHEILDGIKIKTTNYGTNMIMTEFMLARNAILPEHSHPNEQSGYLVRGRMRLLKTQFERCHSERAIYHRRKK
jgi:hypothetical protein